jgi:BMFP domain-containing protein YqiC
MASTAIARLLPPRLPTQHQSSSTRRSQAERMLRKLDVVQREEFEAVKAMAEKAGKENERLKEIADAKANKA